MSRRKQSKPQHVEFGSKKNVSLSSETQPIATVATIAMSGAERVDRGEHFILTETPSSQPRASDYPIEAIKAGRAEIVQELEKSARDGNGISKVKPASDLLVLANESPERRRNDFSIDGAENADVHRDTSAESEASLRAQLVLAHRSLLHPRFEPITHQKQRREVYAESAANQNFEKNLGLMLGKSPSPQQEGVTRSHTNSEERGTSQSMEKPEEVYTCERCDTTFDLIEDFVQHKNFECGNPSPAPNAADRRSEEDSQMSRENAAPPVSSYVVSGNVIMANGEGGFSAEIDERQDSGGAVSSSADDDEYGGDERRGYDTGRGCVENGRTENSYSTEADSGSAQAEGRDGMEKYSGNRGANPGSPARFDASPAKMEHPFLSGGAADQIDSHMEEQYGNETESDETEKLRKEILATEAMAQAIQNMTAFASQSGDENFEKPDVAAIKYQVRMIQQQQAYQMQMLNFLQWQLALASSNPQAAVAAAAAARSRGAVIPNGIGPMNPAVPPPFLAMAGGLPGSAAFMPQMMAAMAMKNFKNASCENNGVSGLAKARIMMGMQQAAADGGNQGIRSMFGAPLLEQEEDAHRNDQEQRYQLKVATDDDCAEGNADEEAKIESGSENEIPRAKSDSGFGEEIRSSSANDGAAADDASSSYGSQEDGELRDSVLKSTAEEHRHRCHYCHKVFGSDSGLQIHIRSHTGERPFKCNICGNRFTTKGNLKVHFTRHKSKYPHIPMNSQPVPEYLDHVPTSNGVPYGMSILPEKAVLERPRLHGNPSIHLSPQQAAVLSQREAQSAAPNVSRIFFPQVNGMSRNPEGNFFRGGERPDLLNGMGPADVASALQAQLLQRRRSEMLESQWAADEAKKSISPEELSDGAEPKNPMSFLQAAMLPFLPGIAARQQLENVPPHLRYLLPHHLNAFQAQNARNSPGDGASSDVSMNITLPTLPESASPPARNQRHDWASKMADSRQNAARSSSETTKLQKLVENIDRGRVLQKNECHTCHRILSCQSALKLHYRTHTGERPYKCDLCARAFTTRGNLRTHYSSVHRQQMRPLPPGGSRSSQQAEAFRCSLCPSRFRDPIEFQHHMQMHALVQAQEQRRMLEMERQKRSLNAADDSSEQHAAEAQGVIACNDVKREPNDGTRSTARDGIDGAQEEDLEHVGKDGERPSSAHSSNDGGDAKQDRVDLPAKNEPINAPPDDEASGDSNSPFARLNPLDSLAALSNIGPGTDMPQHTGSMLDHQLAALSRARAGRLTVCEICEKPFSCQSALEIHLRTHTNERPFLCKICQRAFTTKGNLKQHLLTHNITDVPEQMLLPVSSPKNEHSSASTSPSPSPSPNESQASFGVKRPAPFGDSTEEPNAKRTFPRHWCHICQKQFSSASSLQIHNRTHTGEKPFSCNACGRAFTTKGNLKVHMGTHVWGAGGSRRGRRISMDNPLISPWMKNMTRTRPAQPLPSSGHVADPAALYQQYAALASGFLNAKQDAAARFMLPVTNGITANSPVSSGGSPHPSEIAIPQNSGANLANPAVSAATEWFLKAYQRTQEQVN